MEKAKKDIDAGIAEVRKRLQSDGNIPADGTGGRLPFVWGGQPEHRVGLLLSERCQHTIREFIGYKEEYVGKSAADDHCLDSLRYLCMGVSGGSGTIIRTTGDFGASKRSRLLEDRR